MIGAGVELYKQRNNEKADWGQVGLAALVGSAIGGIGAAVGVVAEAALVGTLGVLGAGAAAGGLSAGVEYCAQSIPSGEFNWSDLGTNMAVGAGIGAITAGIGGMFAARARRAAAQAAAEAEREAAERAAREVAERTTREAEERAAREAADRAAKEAETVASSLKKVGDIRDSLRIGKGRNIGFADYSIDGKSGELIGVSGLNAPKGTVGLPSNPRFTPTVAPAETGFVRAADSEYKILEDLASKLSPDSKGVVNLFTERPACESCQGIIEQFEKAFPGVKVNLIEGPPR